MMAWPYIKAQTRATHYISIVFTFLQRHKFLVSSIAAFLSAYLYLAVDCTRSAGGKMANTQSDSHEELPPQSPPPPPPPSSPQSASERRVDSQEEKMGNTKEERNGHTQEPKMVDTQEEKKGNSQEEKFGNTQEDSTENLLPPESPSAPQRFEARESAGFKLTETCLLFLHRGDITKWFVDGHSDAIVNAANKRLLGGGGVDGAIHSAAGPDLYSACLEIPEVRPGVRCPVGRAKITRGFQLSVAYIIHTVGPIYFAEEDPERTLSDAYRSSLDLARQNEVKYIAFPAISCGIYGYPYDEAAEVSLTTVRDSANDVKEVHFILFEAPAWKAWVDKANELFEQA